MRVNSMCRISFAPEIPESVKRSSTKMKKYISVLCFLGTVLCIAEKVSAQCNYCDLKGKVNSPYKCDGLKKRNPCENAGCYFCPSARNPKRGACYRGFACRRDNYTSSDIEACRDNDTHIPTPLECLQRPGCSYCYNGDTGSCISDVSIPDTCTHGHGLSCYPFPDPDITESQCTATDGCKYCGEETEPEKRCVRSECPSGTELRYDGKSCCAVVGESSSHTRIVGGVPAQQDKWPWLVSLSLVRPDGTYFCGGVLISNQYVLSAAHCNSPISNSIVVEYGSVLLSNQQQVTATSFVNHPNYAFPLNDIMVITIPPIQFSSSVNSLSLPQGEEPPVGMKCFVAGWGSTYYGGSVVQAQREVGVDIVSNSDCSSAYANIDETIHICAGDLLNGGVDSCQGDSGGPLMCQRCQDCGWYLTGIVSFGNACALASYPGVYARVSGFTNWIFQQTGIATNDAMYNCDFYN